jgi:hypothetical protein
VLVAISSVCFEHGLPIPRYVFTEKIISVDADAWSVAEYSYTKHFKCEYVACLGRRPGTLNPKPFTLVVAICVYCLPSKICWEGRV